MELASQLFEYFAEDPRVFDGNDAQQTALQVFTLPYIDNNSMLPQRQTLLHTCYGFWIEYVRKLVSSFYMLCMLSSYLPLPSASDGSCMQSFTVRP